MADETTSVDQQAEAVVNALLPQLDAAIDRRVNERLAAVQAPAEPVATISRPPAEPRPAGALHVHDRSGDRPWASLGENLIAIAQASMPHGERDTRLVAASGASAGDPATGGFLIGTQFATDLLDRGREASPLLPLVRRWPVAQGNDGIEYPYIEETSRATGSRWGGVRVYRKKEAATVTASMAKIETGEIRLYEIMGLAYATERLLRNAPAVAAIFSDAFASEFAFKVDAEIMAGDGAGECLGIIASGNGNKVAQAKETGQAAATIVTANLSKMWTHMPSRLKSRAVWLINSEVTPQLDELTVPAGTGAVEPRIVRYGEDGVLRIKGRPVVEIEQCEALGTEGDIILAALSEYVVITQGDLEQQESMHVRFLYNEMTFRWNYYINGQPLMRSTVTPYKGSATLSPFVTLATRS